MSDEQKEGATEDAVNARIRRKDERELSHGSQLAADGTRARRGGTEAIEQDYVLGDPDDGVDDGKAEEGAKAGQEWIEEIDPLTLPCVAMSELRYLPTCAGIYFAIEEDGTVAYIGQSVNIYNRWRAHHVQQALCDLNDLEAARRVRLAWLEVSDLNALYDLERALIRKFKPRLNDSYNRLTPTEEAMAKLLTTTEAAERLGVSARRVRALITAGTLKAHQLGREYAIEEGALAQVTVYRKPGRPPKTEKKGTKKK